MSFPVSCPHCQKKLRIHDDAVGKTIKCPNPNCSGYFQIDASGSFVPRRSAPPIVRAQSPQEVREVSRSSFENCPYCRGEVPQGAKKCMHCGETIDLALREAEAARRAVEGKSQPIFNNVVAGGGGGGASSSSSSAASAAVAPAPSSGGLGWLWSLLGCGAFLLLLPMCLCCGCRGCLSTMPGPGISGMPQPVPQPSTTTGTLQIQFAADQNFTGLEVFLDSKVQRQQIWSRQLNLQLAPGDHTVAIKINGKDEFSRVITVKAADQGITRLDVPMIVTGDGTLQIDIKPLDAQETWARGLEMFVDGKLTKHDQGAAWWTSTTLRLSPGEHEIALKKNGIQVFSERKQVKKPTDGTTFLKIDLVVAGTVVITCRGILPGQNDEVYVDVNGGDAKRWPTAAKSVTVACEVGKHVIRVYQKRPVDRIVQSFNVEIEPGKTVNLTLN